MRSANRQAVAEGKPGEETITGSEYERRLAPQHDILLGHQHRQWLLEHQQEHPAFMALLGKVYIDFPGIVVVSEDGDRSVSYCDQGGSRWGGDWGWLGYRFNSSGRVAVVGK